MAIRSRAADGNCMRGAFWEASTVVISGEKNTVAAAPAASARNRLRVLYRKAAPV